MGDIDKRAISGYNKGKNIGVKRGVFDMRNGEKNNAKTYKALEIDFEIPEILQDNIELFVKDLNERNGRLADCYEAEIRSLLNGCDGDLSEEQILLLREYYCRGGIYD